ncbi:hypothetical protein GQ651_01295 [Alphaproteobacteria bacterium GH1-50]|uniref:Uncharacterized protein n=1 Tax=Kangsaoukella pontilimi TaxID=2691042 RepID=A0A7C9M864_9RHOB|nr:hypothetical protein [Kangsaoukella pontilimi]MXQ06473.1 hypothetical protein [Kangsaoukella pontilimi]
MQRLVLAALFVVAVVAIGAVLARGAARLFEASGDDTARATGNAMQRTAFFLLLVVMIYAVMTGAS